MPRKRRSPTASHRSTRLPLSARRPVGTRDLRPVARVRPDRSAAPVQQAHADDPGELRAAPPPLRSGRDQRPYRPRATRSTVTLRSTRVVAGVAEGRRSARRATGGSSVAPIASAAAATVLSTRGPRVAALGVPMWGVRSAISASRPRAGCDNGKGFLMRKGPDQRPALGKRLYGVKRWMYRGGRPDRLARVLNRFWAVQFAAGRLSRERDMTLEVPGRRTGRLVSFPVVVADYQGERYLVSMLGKNANWVLNVRATGGRAVLRRGRSEDVLLEEVDVRARAPILRRYLQVAPGARPHLPVDPRAPLQDFGRIADQHPVFRIVTAPTVTRDTESQTAEPGQARRARPRAHHRGTRAS
jgi:hypothetical protein